MVDIDLSFYQHYPHPGGDLGIKVMDLEFS